MARSSCPTLAYQLFRNVVPEPQALQRLPGVATSGRQVRVRHGNALYAWLQKDLQGLQKQNRPRYQYQLVAEDRLGPSV